MLNLNSGSVPMAHIRFGGMSRDVELARLGLADGGAADAVRAAVARWLEVDERQLADHVVERHANGNVTVRPEAVFG